MHLIAQAHARAHTHTHTCTRTTLLPSPAHAHVHLRAGACLWCCCQQGDAAYAASASEAQAALLKEAQQVVARLQQGGQAAPRTAYVDWSRADVDGFTPQLLEPRPAADLLGDVLLLLYAKYQQAAARKVGRALAPSHAAYRMGCACMWR